MRSFLILLGSLVACAGPSSAATVNLRAPGIVAPLAGNVEVTVVASGISEDGDELRVLQGANDVTAGILESHQVVTATDEDGDEFYEAWEHRYVLDLSELSFDTQLVLEATAFDDSGQPVAVRRGISMIPPAHVATPQTSWVTAVDGTVARFYLHIQGGVLTSKAVIILKNELDVTPAADVTERVIWDETRNGYVVDRMIEIEVDLASISFGLLDDTLQVQIDVSFVNWFSTIVSPVIVEVDPAAEAAKRASIIQCLSSFLLAANISSAGGSTTVGGAPGDVAAAAEDLAACLKNRGMSSGSTSVSVPGFGTVIVGFKNAAGAADLVVAVGSEGGTGMQGDDAAAENTQSGGAAVAVAGEGGPGETGGCDASSTSNGGTSVAIGGAGGDGATGAGGPGGAGKATDKLQGGKAVAKGGDGGDPALNAPGGTGGGATANCGPHKLDLGGGEGGAGTYGTGATAIISNGTPSGAAGTGGH